MDLLGRLLQQGLQLRVHRRRTDLHRRPGLILVFIVVKALLGNDLDGGQGLLLQHTHLDLPARDILFHNDPATEVQPGGECRRELGTAVGDRHPNGGAGDHRLHHQGKLQALAQSGDLPLGVLQ